MEDYRSSDANPPPFDTLKKFFAMAKGDGEDSYCKNSEFQAFANKVPMLALDEALEKVSLPSRGGSVHVADLGSSSGPNTISNVAQILDKLRHRLPNDAEFQAYFNDLPSNDFNTLFQLLSTDSRARNFYASGAPGSFWDRIFPQSSVHVFYSSMSVHWLSKIPDDVYDKESPAYNKGMIWYQHSRSAVARSFQQQALIDLKSFFQARAAELVSGGLLFLVFNGRETSEPNEIDNDLVYNAQLDVNKILDGIVEEGLVTEQQQDTFNFPVYHRSSEDIREALECCGSMFEAEIMKVHKVYLKEAYAAINPNVLPKKLKSAYSAGLNPLMEAHFGVNVTALIWQRFEKLIAKNIGTRPEILTVWVVGLIRSYTK